MTSRNRSGDTVEPGVSPAWQSDSHPRRLRLKKNNIRIRDAELSDASQLAALMCELDYETTPAEMETRLKSILSNPAYKTFVAAVDGLVCGMRGTVSCYSYEPNNPGG